VNLNSKPSLRLVLRQSYLDVAHSSTRRQGLAAEGSVPPSRCQWHGPNGAALVGAGTWGPKTVGRMQPSMKEDVVFLTFELQHKILCPGK
jgi:hypothetical protein